MNSSWDLIKKGIIVINHLRNVPAAQPTLRKQILHHYPDAFSQATPNAQTDHFKKILAALRKNLEVDIWCDRSTNEYHLKDPCKETLLCLQLSTKAQSTFSMIFLKIFAAKPRIFKNLRSFSS